MKRRDFLKKTVVATAASGTFFSMGKWNSVFGMESNFADTFDMVAVKNGEPAEMFNAGITALGGMKTFVKPNQTVLVKPNIGWDAPPERAANTNPELVGRIVKLCLEAGAKKVMVFDHTCDEWTLCYKNSGIEKAVKDNGGQLVSGKTEDFYRPVTIPKGIKLKEARVHELVLESDVFINVPVLKNHGGAAMSLTMKNLMGVVWNRGYWHSNDLHQCIADFASYCKPTLNVIDGYRVMKTHGPRGVSVDDVALMKYQLIGRDMVALDTAATKIFGIETQKVNHIRLAEQLGVGTTNLDALNIKRITL